MSGGSHHAHVQSELRCPECGNIQFVWRKSGRKRKRGHVKHMWCPVCREVTGHLEGR